MSKVISVGGVLVFDTGHILSDEHNQDCCESHYLSFDDLKVEDFAHLDFDLTGNFFERVEDFGIRLISTNGTAIPIPGYGSNNGYYGSNIDLVLQDGTGKEIARFDVSECQKYDEYW